MPLLTSDARRAGRMERGAAGLEAAGCVSAFVVLGAGGGWSVWIGGAEIGRARSTACGGGSSRGHARASAGSWYGARGTCSDMETLRVRRLFVAARCSLSSPSPLPPLPLSLFPLTDLRQALIERAQTTLRHVVGARAAQSMVTEREAIAIIFSAEVSASLSSAAQQKRLGESMVVAARAEVDSAQLMRQAADILVSPAAMQIRQLKARECIFSTYPLPSHSSRLSSAFSFLSFLIPLSFLSCWRPSCSYPSPLVSLHPACPLLRATSPDHEYAYYAYALT
ncbi:hypothetical protein B0H17DRAFT_1331431 [Mycena rosella]|uniref:Prohibitin n=1 Tax=Mycena rosella TaxID=1033263 RepID=A0AAD7DIH9_MYCRO|nr:hypothetical protein B0H17DRAFT_1331431 [Mycena rosella]